MSSHIVNTTDATFELDVVARSQETPVVVDFWATWCGPCRALGPVLESLAESYGGRFVLAKAETEQNQQAAAQFGVSSIPAVFGVVGGQVVDGFVGALPERQLRVWLDRLLEMGAVAATLRLAETDPAAALPRLQQFAEQEPNNSDLKVAMAKALQTLNRHDECRAVIAELERRGFLEPEAERIKAALELGEMKSEGLDELRAAAAANPQDLAIQVRLGETLAANRLYEEALECLLLVVQKDRHQPREEAKRVMVDIFRILPDDSPLVSTYRRKLSTALY